MPGVVEVNLINGLYDIVVKITSDALELERNYNLKYKNNRHNQINYDIDIDRIKHSGK